MPGKAASAGQSICVSRLLWVLVAGDEGDGAGDAALRYGNAGVGRCCDPRSYTRNYLNCDPALEAGDRFFAAAPEDERVAALQPDDAATGQGVLDHQLVRDFLRYLLAAADLADVDQLCVAARAVERARTDQLVVEDYVGAGKQLCAAQSNQPFIARARSDEVNSSGNGAHRPSTSLAPDASIREPTSRPSSSGVLASPLIVNSSRSQAEPSVRPTKAASVIASPSVVAWAPTGV